MKSKLFMLAIAVLAISLSAFIPSQSPDPETVYYLHDEDWVSEVLTPCPDGNDPVCEIMTTFGTKQIFKSESELDPFKKPLIP